MGKSNKKRNKGKLCPLCNVRPKCLKSHVQRKHFPWYTTALTACWECQIQEGRNCFFMASHGSDNHPNGPAYSDRKKIVWDYLMNGVLHLLCHQLGLNNFQKLLGFVKTHHLYSDLFPNVINFTNSEIQELSRFEEVNGLSVTKSFSISPPNSTAALTHWRVLSNILNKLTPAAQTEVFQLYSPLYISGVKFTEFIDDVLDSN